MRQFGVKSAQGHLLAKLGVIFVHILRRYSRQCIIRITQSLVPIHGSSVLPRFGIKRSRQYKQSCLFVGRSRQQIAAVDKLERLFNTPPRNFVVCQRFFVIIRKNIDDFIDSQGTSIECFALHNVPQFVVRLIRYRDLQIYGLLCSASAILIQKRRRSL